ncbi:hypothetical protein IWZ01DRAFT_478846 [Phyllosticta capitalensis]
MRLEIRGSGASIASFLFASIVTVLYTCAIFNSNPDVTVPNSIGKASNTLSANSCDCPFQIHDFIKHRKRTRSTEKYLFRPIGWELVCQEAPGCCRLQIQVARAQVMADIEKKGEFLSEYHEQKRLRLEECEYEFREMERCEG